MFCFRDEKNIKRKNDRNENEGERAIKIPKIVPSKRYKINEIKGNNYKIRIIEPATEPDIVTRQQQATSSSSIYEFDDSLPAIVLSNGCWPVYTTSNRS
jgi:hypothetical protein